MAGILLPSGARSLGAFTAALRANLARFEADVSAVMEREGPRALRELRRQWPAPGRPPGWTAAAGPRYRDRRTGRSRDSWRWEKVGKLEWRHVNFAAYASFIHPPGIRARIVFTTKPTIGKYERRVMDELRALLRQATTAPVARRSPGRIRL